MVDPGRKPHATLGGVGYLIGAGAFSVVVFTRERLVLPVTLDLPGALPGASDPTPPLDFGAVDLGVAVIVVLVFSAAMQFGSRMPGATWIERGVVAAVTTFLVAQLNGITDAGALIAIYALTSAMVLFDLAQLRADRIGATSPWGFGTMVGIVPWGIIALHQVGGAVAGHPAPLIVQVITMSVLVLSAATSFAFWREQKGQPTAPSSLTMSNVTTCVFAIEVGVALLIA